MAAALRCVPRTRLRCAGAGGATPHAGDQLEPPFFLGPEPAIALAPHPPVPGIRARAVASPMALVVALVHAERLPLDEVAELRDAKAVVDHEA